MSMYLMNNVSFLSMLPEIIEYADYIGIELPGEEFLLPLAKEGITAHLPLEWQACSAPDG